MRGPSQSLVYKLQNSAAQYADSQKDCRLIQIERSNVETLASRAFRGWCARVLLGRIRPQPGDRAAKGARS